MISPVKRFLTAILVGAALTGCAGLSARDKNTAVGAVVGGVAGSILTNGGGVGTVGGAAIGGYIGNQIRH